MLANLASDSSIAEEKDSVGSGGPMDSGLYMSTITMAYLSKSSGGAQGLVFSAKTDDGKEFRQTLWMTSGDAKGNKNFYEKDGVKSYLPGFNHANSIALLTVSQEIGAIATEEKVVKVYSYEAQAEVPTKVQVFTDLIGKQILLGVIKQTVDKTKKDDHGVYQPTGETREENDLDKVFRARDRMTTSEVRGKAIDASFADVWTDKWAGKVKNKSKGGSGVAGVAGAPKAGGAAASKKPTTSLFA